jgi:protein-tyrosine phosphatase
MSHDVFWIDGTPLSGLAIVLRPRGGDWLEDELSRLKTEGVEGLVSLLEVEEAEELGLADEGTLAQNIGLKYWSYPIPDRHIPPNIQTFQALVNNIAIRITEGARIGVHCRGSIGRATITAACTLIHLGLSPDSALAAIEATRGCPVPDTQEQQEWILRYEAPA